MMKNVLILCTGNSCRSQMAHGYLSVMLLPAYQVYSAGIETHGVNWRAVAVMKEDGIDLSSHRSHHISEYLHILFDVIITVCDDARESCPFFPGDVVRIHRSFADPARVEGSEEEIMEIFRQVRDEIKAFCEGLSIKLNVAH